jgi:hypothetical protein
MVRPSGHDVPNSVRFIVSNVGQDTAYLVSWTLDFFVGNDRLLHKKSDPLDLPPGEDTNESYPPDQEDFQPVVKAVGQRKAVRYAIKARYLLAPEGNHRYCSNLEGKMTYVGNDYLWELTGRSLDRPCA